MYKPTKPRPKKTNITRTRTGCLGCRDRRVKCDNLKPICGRCQRLGGECKQDTAFKFCQVYQPSVRPKPTKNCEKTRGALDLELPTANRIPEDGANLSAETAGRTFVDAQAGLVALRRSALTIPQSLMPRTNPVDAARFYLAAWDWKYLVPPSVLCTGNVFSLRSSPLFADMMVALSASHLSRTSPQRRLPMGSSTGAQNFRPNPGHESLSGEFYGSVMRKMTRWSAQDFGSHPLLGLALITLFCFIESSMGSFPTFELHYDGATQLIRNYAARTLAKDGQAADLVKALIEVRMQMWWRRVYFGTAEFHRNRPAVLFDLSFPDLLARAESRRTSILLMLCESHRIHNAAIIAHWDLYGDEGRNCSVEDQNKEKILQKIDSLDQLMGGERDRLDAWSQIHAFPSAIRNSEANLHSAAAPLEVLPLHTSSHDEAMTFSYYIALRVLQQSGPLDSLRVQSPGEIRESYKEVDSWIQLLLRVIAGMDWNNCVHFNMYTIGITGVLLACLLRSHDPAIGLWCEEWLQSCLDGSSFEEGGFPVCQTMSIIRLINDERSQGRDTFGLFQTIEDGGGSGKFGSYQSQALSSLVVYSRCRKAGILYSRCISI
ncbi:Fungal transcriptional regulatory [Cordyceps militaris]|uniref:Fungal transcriptional regulatory n=1 Tax=Cordyceps militaris TaxID=73501 RepID=A0A2H4S9G0_CORMI|nr:Fungal transcriptional regulatory [Cordyceps militaris]